MEEKTASQEAREWLAKLDAQIEGDQRNFWPNFRGFVGASLLIAFPFLFIALLIVLVWTLL